MNSASRSLTTLEQRIERLEQRVSDLTRVVERLNQMMVEERHDGHVVETFGRSADHGLPSVNLRLDR